MATNKELQSTITKYEKRIVELDGKLTDSRVEIEILKQKLRTALAMVTAGIDRQNF